MGVEHHLLGLARIGPHIDRPRRAQPHVGHLHPHRLAARSQRPRGCSRTGTPRPARNISGTNAIPPSPRRPLGRQPPARRVAPHRSHTSPRSLPAPAGPRSASASAGHALAAPRSRPAASSRSRTGPSFGKRLLRALIVERPFSRPDRLAHHLARQPQLPRDRPDRLARRVLPPDPNHCLHYQHPDLAAWRIQRPCLNHRNEGSLLGADHPANGVPFARRSTTRRSTTTFGIRLTSTASGSMMPTPRLIGTRASRNGDVFSARSLPKVSSRSERQRSGPWCWRKAICPARISSMPCRASGGRFCSVCRAIFLTSRGRPGEPSNRVPTSRFKFALVSMCSAKAPGRAFSSSGKINPRGAKYSSRPSPRPGCRSRQLTTTSAGAL